jgi:toxin CcdB
MQFDVFEIAPDRLVLVLQSDAAALPTCVVAPLFPSDPGPTRLTVLEPVLDIQGKEFVLHVGELAAIPTSVLKGDPVATCRDREWEIRKALDFLLSGV